MNNKKILVVGFLAVIVTMMVGYALFSENITINGTATAKGSFQLETSCVKGATSKLIELGSTYGMKFSTEGGYQDDYCTVSANTVSFGAKLLYPGALRYYTVSIKNTGTIDALLNMETGIEMNLGTVCSGESPDGPFNDCTNVTGSSGVPLAYVEIAGIIDSNGNDVTLQQIYNDEGVLDDEGSNLMLKVGDTMLLPLINYWNDTLVGSNNKVYLESTGASFKFDFSQITN